MVNFNPRMQIFSLKIGGQAGQGIKSAGLMLAKVATRSGYNIYTYTEYPSLVRGGHNIMQICISQEEVAAPQQYTNFLIALNQETIDEHHGELVPGSSILFDNTEDFDTSKINSDITLLPIPFQELVSTAGGSKLMLNTAAMGATVALHSGDLQILNDLISQDYANAGAEMIALNQKVAKVSYDYVHSNFQDKIKESLKPLSDIETKMIVNGNEAIALSSIASGLQYAAIYPMTPTSNILTVLAENQEKYNFIYKQPEDEIAAINMAIGASFAGCRSMVATSGGGFCLMSEGYGLAANIETPLVIVEGMRPGPATGVPTWSDQGDLHLVLHAHQGDFPRIVLAAGDAQESYDLTKQCFDLADKYQSPVILLVDKNICEGDQSIPVPPSDNSIDRGKFSTDLIPNYQRFAPSPDGVSLRSIPGVGNFFIGNSDEHDTFGYSSESIEVREASMEKRMSKMDVLVKELPKQQLFGANDADLTIVSWGSNKGAILQAIKDFDNVNYLHITHMSPFPPDVKEVLDTAKNILDIECNFTGQLAELIREKTGILITNKLLKYSGRPIYPEEIIEKINSLLKI
ncbi:MAG: 2-oxoacid:acceptor oxidoreductase subunit alpha [Candidatus Daviesbacteria bacterium]|nr:2-oxoacid:acceptor oxidoreductase subunit alpha [Candidatus Daviesbacteria bacterium]